MRRVGIVLGALGCVAGGAIGYWNLQDVWSLHTRFERLQALPVMLDVNWAIKGYQDSLAMPIQIDPQTGERVTPAPPDFIPDWGQPVYTAQAAYAYDKAVALDPAAEITVDVKGTDGIQTVNADKSGVISSIQLTTGEWVRRGAKTLKARLAFIASLLLPFCYPVIGFLVPWGTIRVFVWVAGGFSAPQSSS
jgi:hypothetical protein